MMTYICNPLTPTSIPNKGEEHAADAENTGANAMGGLEPPPGTNVKDRNLLGRVMRKVGEFMGRLWDKMKGFAKTMQSILYTTLRCGVCVVCNIVNEIVALFKQLYTRGMGFINGLDTIGKNLWNDTSFFDHAGNRARELFGSKGKVKANDKKLELGTSCITAEDCVSGYCAGGRFAKKCVEKHAAKVGEVCTGRDDCEKGLFCKSPNFSQRQTGLGSVCTQLYKIGDKCYYDHSCATGYCKGMMRKKCAERAPKSSKGEKRRRRLLALTSAQRVATRQHQTAQHRVRARKMRQLHRLSVMVQAADKIDRAFAEGHLMNNKMAASLITSIVSFMQVHSRKREAAKAKAKAKVESNAKFAGIIPLPNACVNEENQGTSMVIAINVENPNVSVMQRLYKP